MRLEGKAVVAQGGGPSAVINQSLVGVVLEARKYPQITKVYGAVNGIAGIVDENFIDLTQETTHNLEMVANTPSSGLHSTRIKPTEEICKGIFKVFKAHDVRYFFYIGGNDSADTVRIVNEEAKKEGYEFRAIHVPKTIDNDLLVNDHTPGYGSAAKFVAQAFMGLNLDNNALPGVHIGVVMGRDAGFLTAAAALAKKNPEDGPHLIYVPERAFDKAQFLNDVKTVYDKYGRCLIAVSEGIKNKAGDPVITELVESEKDDHGNVQLSGTGALGDSLAQLIKDELKIERVRADTFGYTQRSFVGCVSDVDQQEGREVGEKAVQFAIWEGVDGSVVIKRTGNYSVNYEITELKNVAKYTKGMPDNFINEEGNYVTDDYISYVTPLLGSDMPKISTLRAPQVKKILKK